MDRVSIFLICLILSFFLTCNADSSLLKADYINVPNLNIPPLKFETAHPESESQRASCARESGSRRFSPLGLSTNSSNVINTIDDIIHGGLIAAIGDVHIADTYVSIEDFLLPDETDDNVEDNTSSLSSGHDLVIPNSHDSSILSGTDDGDVAASSSSISPVHALASVHNRLSGDETSDNVEATEASTSSAHSHVIPDSFSGGDIAMDHVTRNGPFELGQINIGLTFQAALALMLFHFEGSNSFASTRTTSFNVIGFSMVLGFTFSLIAIFLRNACPRLAAIGDQIGLLSTALGFFMMIEMFLPHSFSWTVWPAFVLVFLAFIFAIVRTK